MIVYELEIVEYNNGAMATYPCTTAGLERHIFADQYDAEQALYAAIAKAKECSLREAKEWYFANKGRDTTGSFHNPMAAHLWGKNNTVFSLYKRIVQPQISDTYRQAIIPVSHDAMHSFPYTLMFEGEKDGAYSMHVYRMENGFDDIDFQHDKPLLSINVEDGAADIADELNRDGSLGMFIRSCLLEGPVDDGDYVNLQKAAEDWLNHIR